MMFSISTMASSTRMPTTSDSDSSVTTLSEKPIHCITMKVGMADSGSATADTKVARQSRRKNHTTMMARTAPSISSAIEPSKFSITGSTKLNASVISTSGCAARSSARPMRTPSATSTSPAPRARVISKPTTGLPLSSAVERCSATVSDTRATWSRRMRRPSASAISSAPSSAAVCTVAMVRTDCSTPPRSVRPPEASCCTSRRRREISAAVTLSAIRRDGSSSTCTSRVTPPTRLTAPTPRTASMRLVTSLSTNQDSAGASMRDDATV